VFFATGKLPEGGVAAADSAADNRINTGVDHTGESWEYIRIYEDSGSGAAGQVGHVSVLGNGFIVVDEVWKAPSKIIPGSGAHDFLVAYIHFADSRSAWFNAPKAGDEYVLVERTRFWPDGNSGDDGTPAIVTVAEILADADLEALNRGRIQAKIDDIKATLNTAAGEGLSFVKVPVIYVGGLAEFDTGRSVRPLTPALTNLQVVNDRLYLPRQFGPRNAGLRDLFEEATKARLPGALFVDDWELYHRLGGGVHCATVTKRQPYAIGWWAN
jgi:hypothetical protein